MEVKPYKPAAIADRESVMEGADMRVSVLTLGLSDCIPWHYHGFLRLSGTPFGRRDPGTAKPLRPEARRTLRSAAEGCPLRPRRERRSGEVPDRPGRGRV